MFYLSRKKEFKKLSIQRRTRGDKIAIFRKIDFWRKFFEGINRFNSSSWSDWCAPGAPERTLGVICSSSCSSNTNTLLFFVKLKVAIARKVAHGFLGRRLSGAKNRENRSFSLNLLHAIEGGSSPVHGTICKIARFVDFDKLWLNQVNLVLSKGKCKRLCLKSYILKGKCGWISFAVEGGSVFPPSHMVNQSM